MSLIVVSEAVRVQLGQVLEHPSTAYREARSFTRWINKNLALLPPQTAVDHKEPQRQHVLQNLPWECLTTDSVIQRGVGWFWFDRIGAETGLVGELVEAEVHRWDTVHKAIIQLLHRPREIVDTNGQVRCRTNCDRLGLYHGKLTITS